MQFLKLTAKTGQCCLLNIRHIIDIREGTGADLRYVVTAEADTSEANRMIAVTETLYQIEQALNHLAAYGGYAVAVAADWPAEEPGSTHT